MIAELEPSTFQEGIDAFRRFDGRATNPYLRAGCLRANWDAGWLFAKTLDSKDTQ